MHVKIQHIHFIVSKIIHTATFLGGGLYLNKTIDLYFWKYLGEKRVPTFVKGATAFFIYMLTIAMIIKFIFSQDEKAFVALTGGMAFILGYAAKEVIAEVFAAFALNVTPIFQKGDVVLYDNKTLHVKDMNWRFVTFVDPKNHNYYVPNSHLTSTSILNFTSVNGETKLSIEFEVSLKNSPFVVTEEIKKAFVKSPYFNKKKKVEIYLNAMHNSFEFVVHFPAIKVFDSQVLYHIKTELYLLLWTVLQENNIDLYEGVSYLRAVNIES